MLIPMLEKLRMDIGLPSVFRVFRVVTLTGRSVCRPLDAQC
jgi:hypothetical protein